MQNDDDGDDTIPLSDEFTLPTNRDIGAHRSAEPQNICTYLCGNSLGPLSKRSSAVVQEELQAWGSRAVVGHFSHPNAREWVDYASLITPHFAELVGANEGEVACMGTLTANLHLMMDSFYKPTPERYKILCEAKAFPSDQYAFASQALAHGLSPSSTIIEVSPRPGEHTLRPSDILDTIAREGPTIALVIFSGVQYYTGQWFPMREITQAAKEQGCICGWDLAHAVGNVPLSLHEWDVDWAVWCTYKYLNAGPGAIAGLFVHEKWNEIQKPRSAGWWGHDPSTRFAMPPTFSPIPGAQGFQQSNPSILSSASLLGSLEIFKAAGGVGRLRKRSVRLTGKLEELLLQSKYYVPLQDVTSRFSEDTQAIGFTILTPTDPESRGAQLSLLFLPSGKGVMRKVHDVLVSFGVIGDEREPDVIRLAPCPLFNSVKDCIAGAAALDRAFEVVLQDK